MSTAIISTLTDTARSKFAELLKDGKAFTVTHFVTGGGGHDQGDPATALTPDPSLTTLPGQTFGPKALSQKNLISPHCVEYIGELEEEEAVGDLSNYGLIATVTYSPIPLDPVVGTTFLFAVGNSPLVVKTDQEERTITVEVQY